MLENYSFLANLIDEDVYYIRSEPDQFSPEKSVMAPVKDKEMSVEDQAAVKNTNYTGQNLKEILVLVNEQDQQFLNPTDEAFLKKVLLAVNVGLNDVSLVNIAGMNQSEMNDIKSSPHELRICFLEKMPEALLETELILYQNTLHERTKILWCHPLRSISLNKDMKIKLWQQLKLLFNK